MLVLSCLDNYLRLGGVANFMFVVQSIYSLIGEG